MKKSFTLFFIFALSLVSRQGFSQSDAFQEELAGARNQTLRINALFSAAAGNNAYGKEFFEQDIAVMDALGKTIAGINADLRTVEKNSNTAQTLEDYNPNFGTTADVISKFIAGFKKWADSNQDEIVSYDGTGEWYAAFMENAQNTISLAMTLDNEIAEVINEIRGHY